MKTQALTMLVLLSSVAFAGTTKRGVHTSTDVEVREANKQMNTAGESDVDNNPTHIDQERMEENPKGTKTDPVNWPKGPASKARTGEKIED